MGEFIAGAAVEHAPGAGLSDGIDRGSHSADPSAILSSLGCLAYSWDLSSGSLAFGGDVDKVLPGDWGHSFETVARLDESAVRQRPGSRRAALFGSDRLDDGSGVPYALTYRLRSKDQREFVVEESGRWFACMPGQPMMARGLLRTRPAQDDHREEIGGATRISIRHIRREALLPLLEEAVDRAIRTHRDFALIGVVAAYGRIGEPHRLDGYLNGYDAGEGVAARLRLVMRRGDTLVRFDDQTSLCILNGCDEQQMATAIKRLKTAFDAPTGGVDDDILGSVAGAVWKGKHADAMALTSTVIEQARGQFGEPGPSPSSPARVAERRRSRDWHGDILAALNERRLVLACQPVVTAGQRSIAFHEGLLRLKDKESHLLPASVFIPESEERGLVSLLDQRVIELAVDELNRHDDLKLAINASPLSLADPQWLSALRAHAANSDVLAGRVILEITESTALADIDRTVELLSAVKDMGMSVAIDDFGAGHTSFRVLRRLPVDIVKIDGAFIQDVDRSSDGRFFVRTLVDLAHHIGCKVVAEWVETEEAARTVEEIGVDYLQGRLLGAPLLLTGAAPEPSARLTA